MTIEIKELGKVTFNKSGQAVIDGWAFECLGLGNANDCYIAAAKLAIEKLQAGIAEAEARNREFRKYWYFDSIRLPGTADASNEGDL